MIMCHAQQLRNGSSPCCINEVHSTNTAQYGVLQTPVASPFPILSMAPSSSSCHTILRPIRLLYVQVVPNIQLTPDPPSLKPSLFDLRLQQRICLPFHLNNNEIRQFPNFQASCPLFRKNTACCTTTCSNNRFTHP